MAQRGGRYSRKRESKYITLRGIFGDESFLSNDEMFEIVALTAGFSEYQNKAQVEAMMKLSGNINLLRNLGRFTITRDAYKRLLAMREKRRYDKFTTTKADAIASFMADKPPHNVKVQRPSSFMRTRGQPRAKERIGSSRGKISVRYIGFTKVNKDFENLIKELSKLGKLDKRKIPNLKKTVDATVK